MFALLVAAALAQVPATQSPRVGEPVVVVGSQASVQGYSDLFVAINETSNFTMPETPLSKADVHLPYHTFGTLQERYASSRGVYLDTVLTQAGATVVLPEWSTALGCRQPVAG